ncbi:MAG TPA: TIGR01777 family oxidoreductase [Agriterribacter sp.]|nr:TIGR01777 family oxidoreductase [Agriterribacter sp.]
MMTNVLITGGTGLIGSRLSGMLMERGYRVIILTRNKKLIQQRKSPETAYAFWNPDRNTIDIAAVQEADFIIHLAGENIAAKRWTPRQKSVIANSRIKGGQLIVQTLRENANQVKAIISASAKDWYGDDSQLTGGKKSYTEDGAPAPGFLGDTCKAWEESIAPARELGKRLVWLRTGLVLSKDGGVLKSLMQPAKFGIAPIFGTGRQIQSWIHIDDICRMYIHALENETLNGVYNAVAPDAVNQKGLVTELAKKMKGSFYIPVTVPAFVMKWMVGEMGTELFKGNTLDTGKIRTTGFRFLFPSLEAALNDLL